MTIRRHWSTRIRVPVDVRVGDVSTAIDKVREYGRGELSGLSPLWIEASWTEEDDWDLRGAIRETMAELRALGIPFEEPTKDQIVDIDVDP